VSERVAQTVTTTVPLTTRFFFHRHHSIHAAWQNHANALGAPRSDCGKRQMPPSAAFDPPHSFGHRFSMACVQDDN